MADNRMFLIHKPTRLGIMLGKRMAWGWYKAPQKNEMEAFFDYLRDDPEGDQDDFILAMEEPASIDDIINGWRCTGELRDGFRIFEQR